MGIFKRAHFRGMAHILTSEGLVHWPSKLAMEESADEVADSFTDEEIPEIPPEDGLTEEQAAAALERLVEVSQELGEKAAAAGRPADHSLQKTAAAQGIEEAMSLSVISLMEKAAEETAVDTGPAIPGATPPTPELTATAEGEVDAVNNPSAAIVVPQGTTSLDTTPGEIGKTERCPDQPGAQESMPVNEASKTAEQLVQSLQSLLTQINTGTQKTAEMDGASLSGGPVGGPVPEPRVDVSDNLDIAGVVAPGQGKTVQDVPATAMAGALMPQPGGTPGPTDATPSDPASDAKKTAALIAELKKTAAGKVILAKIAETYAEEDEKEKKKSDKKEEKPDDEPEDKTKAETFKEKMDKAKGEKENNKEAAANQVLANLLQAVR